MYQIYAISDATGQTAEGVVRAALTQFDASEVHLTRYGGVRTPAQIREIVTKPDKAVGLSSIPCYPKRCAGSC